jgi:hypothetical protein
MSPGSTAAGLKPPRNVLAQDKPQWRSACEPKLIRHM